MNRLTVGDLLEGNRRPLKRGYQEISVQEEEMDEEEDEERMQEEEEREIERMQQEEELERSEEEERVARELVTMARESEKNSQDLYGGGDYGDADLPDEIECQLIQKTLLINGAVQTIDFIMCNQCPRLFRTENLLWNHIKGKHNRRGVRKPVPPPPRSIHSPSKPKPLLPAIEPGEIITDTEERVPEEPYDELEEVRQQYREEYKQQLKSLQREFRGEEQHKSKEQLEKEKTSSIQYSGPTSLESNRIQSGVRLGQSQEPLFIVGVEKGLEAEEVEEAEQDLTPPTQETPTDTTTFIPGVRKYTCWNGTCTGEVFTNKKTIENHIKKFHEATIVDCDLCGKQVIDIKRHREVSHKKFRVFDCSHCSDKFCSQEDLNRHLRNVERRNIVSKGAVQTDSIKQVYDDDEDEEKEFRTEDLEVAKFVKELENQAFSCSDCGVKTPSRMTYIQHVLNGCIMDEPEKKMKKDRRGRAVSRPPMSPIVTKHVIIQHDGRREHIIVEQDRELSDVVREQLGHQDQQEYNAIRAHKKQAKRKSETGKKSEAERRLVNASEAVPRMEEKRSLMEDINSMVDGSEPDKENQAVQFQGVQVQGAQIQGVHVQEVQIQIQETQFQEEPSDSHVESLSKNLVSQSNESNSRNVQIPDFQQNIQQTQEVLHEQGHLVHEQGQAGLEHEQIAQNQEHFVVQDQIQGYQLVQQIEITEQVVQVTREPEPERVYDEVTVGNVVEHDDVEGGVKQPLLEVVEGEGGEHVIHVTEEQLAQLQAHAQFVDSR